MLQPVHFCQRRRGNSVPMLLFLLALTLGLTLFVWQNFIRYRPLIRAGKNVTVMTKYDLMADMEYRRHFKERNQANVQRCRANTGRFVADTVRGKYASSRDDFDQRHDELLQELLASIDDLDSNSVPPAFLNAHLRLSTSHRPLYESLQELKLGYYAEGSVRNSHFDTAKKRITEGSALSQQGEQGIVALIQGR